MFYCSCQLQLRQVDIVNYNNVQLRIADPLILPSDIIKRNSIINDFRKSATVNSLDIQYVPGVSTTMYSVPIALCDEMLCMEFIHLCVTPVSAILALGCSHSNSSNLSNTIIGVETVIHGIKQLDSKLELMLQSQSGPVSREDGVNARYIYVNCCVLYTTIYKIANSLAQVLHQYEEQLDAELVRYNENLMEDVTPEQGEQFRMINDQLQEKEADTKYNILCCQWINYSNVHVNYRKVRNEIDKERRTQDMLLKECRLQNPPDNSSSNNKSVQQKPKYK